MTLLALTVNDASPALTTRAQEVQRIARALDLAATDIRRNGGTKSSGNINDDGAALIGSWTYVAQAAS